MNSNINDRLLHFLAQSPTAFHAAANLRAELDHAGFTELHEDDAWALQPGGRYYVGRNGSALISFILPDSRPGSFHIIAAHSDSPSYKIKPGPALVTEGFVRLNVERYGGPVDSSWFDRPLSFAGRVLMDEGDHLRAQLVWPEEDLLIIPSLAPHLTRHEGAAKPLNVQTDLLPVLCGGGDADAFWKQLAARLGTAPEQILGADLYLCVRELPRIWGPEKEFLSAARLDDLECVYCTFLGFLDADPGNCIAVHCVFDNEEVGSRSRQGADSGFLRDVLQRLCASLRLPEEDYHRLISRSFLVSADNAHAVHPNFSQNSDPVNRPKLNQGIVLKHQGSLRYATDALSAAILRKICRDHQIPCQDYTNRSDIPGGSTLGSLSESQIPLLTADIGLGQLAMHSCFETAGARDPEYLVRFSEYYYSEPLPRMEADL
ncbi:MAG: M18 family aminopeptidase [Oscillospiraceae bacterium]|nr:M18 family aminopeptidase [Oscillospiraceae bacterium]